MSDEAIIFGVLASIVFFEFTQISPGGIIVPGYIALLLDSPLRVLGTVGISLLTLIVVRALSEYMILFGKRRFAVFIIVSFLLRYLLGLLSQEMAGPTTAAMTIGYLIPGILAQEMDRQGVIKTVSAMMIVALTIRLVLLAFSKSNGL